MSVSLSQKEFSLMQKYIMEHCGIALGEEKAYLIESRLSKLLADSGLSSFEELYKKIYNKHDPIIAEKVIDAITTNETLWFRDEKPWDILTDILLPNYIKELREGKRSKVRIWSAACSTGQEPYSIAMSIDSYLKRNGIYDVCLSHFDILATDISHTVLQVARLGKYDSTSILRGMSEDYKKAYFCNEGRVWTLNERIRNSVRFQQFNLQNSFLLLGKFDMVFCRYVIIYFSEKLKDDVYKKIADCLNPNGILFIGSSEIFNNYADRFDMKQYKNSVYYQAKG